MAYYTEPVKDDPWGLSQFEIDLKELSPAERVQAEAKLLNKTVPDLKAVDANIMAHNVQLTIEDRLSKLCEEENDE